MRRFIDVGYTEKSINNLLENCKRMIDKINEDNECPDELKDFQFLIFAGMVSYYGYDGFNEIVEAFRITPVTYVRESFEVYASSHPEIKKNFKQNPIAITHRDLALLFPAFKIVPDNYILLFGDNNFTEREWLEIFAHELNHCVNSVLRPAIFTFGDLLCRTGCSAKSLSHAWNGMVFEEAINVLQTADIVNHILGFTYFNIYNSEIARIVGRFRKYANWKSTGMGYERIVPYIRPLYEDPIFGDVIVRARRNGQIEDIRDLFEVKTYPGAYDKLLEAVDGIQFDVGDVKDNIQVTKNVIGQYVKK